MTALDQGNERKRRLPEGPRAIAHASLSVFGVIAAAVTVVAIVESYSNLYDFLQAHDVHGWRAAIGPCAADAFILMGELLLFAAILLHWKARLPYATGVLFAVWGFALSVGGNIWHAPAATVADRAVSAIWPVTATAGLAGGLIIAKRLIAVRKAPAVPRQAPPPAPAAPPREPRPPRAKARGPAPAAARGRLSAVQVVLEQEIAAELAALIAAGGELPAERQVADERFGGNRRAAARVLALVRQMSNGKHDGDLARA